MWSMLAILVEDSQTGVCKPKIMWTPEGPAKPPPYTTVFEVLGDRWEPLTPRLDKGAMTLWLKRRYEPTRKGNLVDETPNPLGGWEIE